MHVEDLAPPLDDKELVPLGEVFTVGREEAIDGTLSDGDLASGGTIHERVRELRAALRFGGCAPTDDAPIAVEVGEQGGAQVGRHLFPRPGTFQKRRAAWVCKAERQQVRVDTTTTMLFFLTHTN
jgi:hypothetical protein